MTNTEINILKIRLDSLEDRVRQLEQNYDNILDRISDEFGKIRVEIEEIKVVVRDETKTSVKEAVNEALSEWFGNPDNMSGK